MVLKTRAVSTRQLEDLGRLVNDRDLSDVRRKGRDVHVAFSSLRMGETGVLKEGCESVLNCPKIPSRVLENQTRVLRREKRKATKMSRSLVRS